MPRTVMLLSGFIGLSPGCGSLPVFVGPKSLPAEIEFVRENQALFAQTEDNPLASITPGVVADDLKNLHGCWGAFGRFADGLLMDWEVYRIDFQQGVIEWQVMGLDSFGFFPEAFVSRVGTFEVDGPGTIVETMTLTSYHDPQTGEPETHSLEPPQTGASSVTVSGDYMKRLSGMHDERDDLVFTRFACP